MELNKDTLQPINWQDEIQSLNKSLEQCFKEKEALDKIIDRLLEAAGYDTITASEIEFERVYEDMRRKRSNMEEVTSILKDAACNTHDRYYLVQAIESALEYLE